VAIGLHNAFLCGVANVYWTLGVATKDFATVEYVATTTNATP
jgi:hypothetical protein